LHAPTTKLSNVNQVQLITGDSALRHALDQACPAPGRCSSLVQHGLNGKIEFANDRAYLVGILGFHPRLALHTWDADPEDAARELPEGGSANPVPVTIGVERRLKLLFDLFPRIHLQSLVIHSGTAFTQLFHKIWKFRISRSIQEWKGRNSASSAPAVPPEQKTQSSTNAQDGYNIINPFL
jgi:hypothetical protein